MSSDRDPSPSDRPPSAPDDFAGEASAPPRNPVIELLLDFLCFLREEKKWWLIPILISLGLIAGLALLLSSPAAPFIYPLF